MNSTNAHYQKRKLQQAKDEKYLEKQLVFLTQNKTEILHNIHKYRVIHFSSDRNHFVHIGIAANLLKTNKRTIHLLATNKLISCFPLATNSIFNLIDVRDFIKSLPI